MYLALDIPDDFDTLKTAQNLLPQNVQLKFRQAIAHATMATKQASHSRVFSYLMN